MKFISFQVLDGDLDAPTDSFTAFVGLPTGVTIPSHVLEKVNITEAMLAGKKLFKEMATEMMEFLSKFESVILVAHNSSNFDEKVLREEFKNNNMKIPTEWRFLDSRPFLKEWNQDIWHVRTQLH